MQQARGEGDGEGIPHRKNTDRGVVVVIFYLPTLYTEPECVLLTHLISNRAIKRHPTLIQPRRYCS